MEPRIRLAEEDDAPGMLAIYAPVVRETTVSFEEEPPALDEFRRRICAVLPDLPWLVCEYDGAIAGYAYASPFKTRAGYRWAVELSVYVAADRHRRGVGRALYTALLRGLALLGYCTAVAVITVPNPPSVALHEAMGFRRVGSYEGIGYKLGQWLDDGVWQREIRPRPAVPAAPLPLSRLRDAPEWAAALAAGAALLRP